MDLLATDEYWDPHAIAGLLKTFLRELPASILTRDLHLRFLAVIGKSELFQLIVCGEHLLIGAGPFLPFLLFFHLQFSLAAKPKWVRCRLCGLARTDQRTVTSHCSPSRG